MTRRISLITILATTFLFVAAQAAINTDSTYPPGEEVELEGVILSRNNNELIIEPHRDETVRIIFDQQTEVKEKKSNPFRSAKKYSREDLLAGLNVRVEGHRSRDGVIRAEEIKFTQDDLKVARTISSRVTPLREKLSAAEDELTETQARLEKDTTKLSSDVEELGDAYREASGKATQARETADAALQGVESTDQRISALDSYAEIRLEIVKFSFDSYQLSAEARQQLDEFLEKIKGDRGYLIEVVGFASPEGDEAYNRRLSQKRADAVVDYMVAEHNLPLRRILRPYGFGEKKLSIKQANRESRAQSRSVEIRFLKSEAYMEDEQSAAMEREAISSGS